MQRRVPSWYLPRAVDLQRCVGAELFVVVEAHAACQRELFDECPLKLCVVAAQPVVADACLSWAERTETVAAECALLCLGAERQLRIGIEVDDALVFKAYRTAKIVRVQVDRVERRIEELPCALRRDECEAVLKPAAEEIGV